MTSLAELACQRLSLRRGVCRSALRSTDPPPGDFERVENSGIGQLQPDAVQIQSIEILQSQLRGRSTQSPSPTKH